MKNVIFTLLICVLAVIILPELVMSQPALPTAPSQAPIDGGLGFLAAAGGYYAYRKLKQNKSEE